MQTLGAQQLVDASLMAHVVGHIAQLAQELTQAVEHPRELLGAHGDQRDDADHEQFAEGESEHGRNLAHRAESSTVPWASAAVLFGSRSPRFG
jgi:hypothetical protein